MRISIGGTLLLATTLLSNSSLFSICCSPAQSFSDYPKASVPYQATASRQSLQTDPIDAILGFDLSEIELMNETFTGSIEREATSSTSNVLSTMLLAPAQLSFTTTSIKLPSFTLFPRELFIKRVFLLSDISEWTKVFSIVPNLSTSFAAPNFIKQSPMERISGVMHSRIFAPLIENATFKLYVMPPVSWTFCEPHCGVDDQTVDAESAFENAQADIREAVMAAFKKQNVALSDEQRIALIYYANSTLLDDFGDFFNRDGIRYHAESGVIVGRIYAAHPKDILPYFVTLKTNVRGDYAIAENVWKRLADDVLLHLSIHKQTRFRDTIAVIFP